MRNHSSLILAGALGLLALTCLWVAMDAFVEPHPEVAPLQLAPEG